MYKSMYICILALLFGNVGMAQLEGNHWFFGDSVILKFTEDSIFVTQAQLSSEEATSTISDKEGNLLFYTNSGFIYNSLHNPIHDEAIFAYIYDPENPGKGNGVPDACLLLPDPKNPDTLFYMLNFGDGLLDYYGIDSRKNFGLGGLIDSAFDIDLGDSIISVDTKMTAVRHGNGRDWWIFLRTGWNTAPNIQFIRWLLTPEGFTGPQYLPITDWVEEEHWYYGNMFFDQSGTRLVVIERTGFEVYDFDRCTGELEQIAIVDEGWNRNFYYAAMSESGNKLYVTFQNFDIGGFDGNSGLFQYDLGLLPDADAIRESRVLIFEESYEDYVISVTKYEPITDNIYFSIGVNQSPNSLYDHNLFLHAITEPEMPGLLCNPIENYFQITTTIGGMRAIHGFPNMPNYALGALQGSPCDTIDTANAMTETLLPSFKVYPNPLTTFLNIQNPFLHSCTAVVFNAQGQEVQSFLLQPGNQVVDVSAWPQGSYSLVVYEEEKLVWSSTLVKME